MKKVLIFLMGLLLLNGCSKDETSNKEVETLKTVKLNFDKLVLNNATVTVADLLAHIKEDEKAGFAIKSLSSSDANILAVSGKAPNYQLTVKKYGQVTLTMVLSKKGYKEVTLKAALVIKEPTLTFKKLVTAKSSITSQEILSQIDNHTGYKVKGITLKDTSFGSVTGTTPNLKITLTKYGNFTADIVLSKTGHLDATIKGAAFERTTNILPAPGDLTFSKYIHTISDGKTIKGAALMKNVLRAVGYSLKSITLKDTSFGTVSGTAPNLTITLKKAGSFNATLTLSKGGTNEDLAAEIEVVLPSLTFPKFTIGYKSALTKAEILANVKGNSTGYSIQTITLSSGASAYATTTATGLDIKKAGSFRATLTLTNPNYFEVSIANAQFEITNFIASLSGGWRDAKAYKATINHATGNINLDVNSADFDIDYKLPDGATITPDPKRITYWRDTQRITVVLGSATKDYHLKVTVMGRDIIKVYSKEDIKREFSKHGYTADYNYLDVSSMTDMSYMFRSLTLSGFKGDISKWDVSNVTDMSYMFSALSTYGETVNQDISDWDVSNVTNMKGMFEYSKSFNQDISKWDVSNVTDMSYMFFKTIRFNQDISKWDVSNVTSWTNIFYRASVDTKNKPPKFRI